MNDFKQGAGFIGDTTSGEFKSPGDFVFGVQGWNWGEIRPRSITFFLDGTAKVCDQHGRSIRGTVLTDEEKGTRKEVYFATCPPSPDDLPNARKKYASHMEVIAALRSERIDWRALTSAGWPQIPYEQLKELPQLPPTPLDELRKIKDPILRHDALRARREVDKVKEEELAAAEAE